MLLCVRTIRLQFSPLALLAHVQLVNIWNFFISFFLSLFFLLRVCQPQAPSELKSLWQGCSHFPLIWNEVYPAPDELNFLCQKPAISKKIMNNARRIPFQISLWGRGSNCEEIKFPLLSLSTAPRLPQIMRWGLFQFDAFYPFKSQSSRVLEPQQQ